MKKHSVTQTKIVLTLHCLNNVWINCSSDIKIFTNSGPSSSNFKSCSRSLEHFFLTVSQINFGNKLPFLWLFHTWSQLLSFGKIRYKIKKKVCNFSFVCFGLMQHFEYLWLLFTIMELISREGLLGFHYDCNGAAISRAYKTLYPEFLDFVHRLWGLILCP